MRSRRDSCAQAWFARMLIQSAVPSFNFDRLLGSGPFPARRAVKLGIRNPAAQFVELLQAGGPQFAICNLQVPFHHPPGAAPAFAPVENSIWMGGRGWFNVFGAPSGNTSQRMCNHAGFTKLNVIKSARRSRTHDHRVFAASRRRQRASRVLHPDAAARRFRDSDVVALRRIFFRFLEGYFGGFFGGFSCVGWSGVFQ